MSQFSLPLVVAALVVGVANATPVVAQPPANSTAPASPSSQSAPAPASELIAKARAEAGKQGKRVFVRFTASWCGWCHKMEKVLDQPAVAAVIRKHYVVVTLDVLE
ncbi:MAG: thioredoxin family protein, partial [Armatimonadaceae bacterium]